MIDVLPDIGELSYNGITWTALYKSKIEAIPEYARDKRSIKFQKVTLSVDGVINADDDMIAIAPETTTDPLMLELRLRLLANAAPLVYSQKGYGTFTVNSPDRANNTWDVAFGPHPELVSFQPLGEGRSALVSWKVTCHIVPSRAEPLFQGVIAFTRSDDLSYDDKGYLAYTVKGELEIAATVRPPFNQIDFVRDRVDSLLNPLVPIGWKPQRRDFNYSEDNRVCNFVFAWEEMAPGGLPLACTDAGGEYVYNNTNKGFNKWNYTLRATYYVRKDIRRNSAWLRFVLLYRNRNPIRFGAANRDKVILTGLRVSEGLYSDSKRTEFEANWTVIGLALRQVLIGSSTWRRIPDSDYRLWRAGVNITPVGPLPVVPGVDPDTIAALPGGNWRAMGDISGWRSWAREAGRLAAKDAIIDIRHQPAADAHLLARNLLDIVGDVDEKDHPTFQQQQGIPQSQADLDLLEMMLLPNPEFSWADYNCEIFAELDPGLAIHKPLPQADDVADSFATLDYQDAEYPKSQKDYTLKSNSTGSDVVQRMATSTYRICVRGFAIRAGYPIPIPGLVSFAGKTPTPLYPQRVWRQSQANISGIPINFARWELWYQLSVPVTDDTIDKYPADPSSGMTANNTPPADIKVPEGVFGGEAVQQEYLPPPPTQFLNPLQGG